MIDAQLDERMRRVRLLVSTRDDYLPQPHVTQLGDVPGPAASRRVPCDTCERTGRYGKRLCPTCGGSAWKMHPEGSKRVKTVAEWCEYTGMPVEEAKQPVGAAGLVSLNDDIQRLTASIDRIQNVLDAKDGLIDHERFGWERQKAMYHREGSYRELNLRLGQLHEIAPRIHGAVVTGRPLRLEAVGVAYLARTMRGQIRVPSFLVFERSLKQAPTVESLHAEGMTAGAIARKLCIPKRKVRQILHAVRPSRTMIAAGTFDVGRWYEAQKDQGRGVHESV